MIMLSLLPEGSKVGQHFVTGGSLNAIAGRISYTLGLRGPSMILDTACSSSLVALHLGCESLKRGESDYVIVAGVNVINTLQGHIALQKSKMLSPSGRCHSFSENADGMVRGEGCGVVICKRLSAAKKDGDKIFGVIKSSVVAQDGASGGFYSS